MRHLLASGTRRVGGWVQRPLIIIGLVLATGYATVGFIHQGQAIRQLTDEVAQRQQELDATRQEHDMLTEEVAALNDPVRYNQYAMLVARHTLMLARPGETLLIVNWQVPGEKPATAVQPTDWKALLRAAGIPSP